MSNFERKIAIIGIGLAAVTAALFYVQLNEMTRQTQILGAQSESAAAGAAIGELNTRKQLVIAQQQAKAATDAVNQAAADSIENAKRVERQLQILRDQAEATRNQAATAAQDAAVRQQQFEASERAWVSLDGIAFSEPLQFTPRGALAAIKYNLRNTGRSPAIAVGLFSKMIPVSMTRGIDIEINEQQSAFCGELGTRPKLLWSSTLFPGDKVPGASGIALYPEDVGHGLKSRESGQFAHKGYLSIALLVCVDYQFSFAPTHHQTRYAFELGIPNADGVSWQGDLKPEGTQPDVRLIYFSQSAD